MQSGQDQAPSAAVRVFVGMGSNVGDRLGHLQSAVDRLMDSGETRVAAVSPVYESTAHVLRLGEKQEDYYNAAVELWTSLPALRLLLVLLEIERQSGRIRRRGLRWRPRTLDLDILLYGSLTIDRPALKVPHPRLAARRFVLQPLVDLDPDLFIPDPFAAPVRRLLDVCPDEADVRRLDTQLTLSCSPLPS